MMGVLNQARSSSPRENPLLSKIAKEAEANVPQELQGQFLSIMVAGGKLMWSSEVASERQAFEQALQQEQDVPRVVAHAVIKICSIIQNESQSEKPLDALGLAAMIFMAHTLQYAEAKHKVPVNEQVIDETAQLVSVNLLKLFGVTEAHIQELIKQRSAQEPSVSPQGEEPAPTEEAGLPAQAVDPGEEEEDV